MAEKKKSDPKATQNLDKRIVERNVAKGVISRADVDAHMKNLPDLQDQADNIADKIYGPPTPN